MFLERFTEGEDLGVRRGKSVRGVEDRCQENRCQVAGGPGFAGAAAQRRISGSPVTTLAFIWRARAMASLKAMGCAALTRADAGRE